MINEEQRSVTWLGHDYDIIITYLTADIDLRPNDRVDQTNGVDALFPFASSQARYQIAKHQWWGKTTQIVAHIVVRRKLETNKQKNDFDRLLG